MATSGEQTPNLHVTRAVAAGERTEIKESQLRFDYATSILTCLGVYKSVTTLRFRKHALVYKAWGILDKRIQT